MVNSSDQFNVSTFCSSWFSKYWNQPGPQVWNGADKERVVKRYPTSFVFLSVCVYLSLVRQILPQAEELAEIGTQVAKVGRWVTRLFGLFAKSVLDNKSSYE